MSTNTSTTTKIDTRLISQIPEIPWAKDGVITRSDMGQSDTADTGATGYTDTTVLPQYLHTGITVADAQSQANQYIPDVTRLEDGSEDVSKLESVDQFYKNHHLQELHVQPFTEIKELKSGMEAGSKIFQEIAKLGINDATKLDTQTLSLIGDLLINLKPGNKVRWAIVPEYKPREGTDGTIEYYETDKKNIVLEITTPMLDMEGLKKVSEASKSKKGLNEKVDVEPIRDTRMLFNLSHEFNAVDGVLYLQNIYDIDRSERVHPYPLFTVAGNERMRIGYKPEKGGVGQLLFNTVRGEKEKGIPENRIVPGVFNDLSTANSIMNEVGDTFGAAFLNKQIEKMSEEDKKARRFFSIINNINPLLYTASVGAGVFVSPLFFIAPLIKELGFYIASRFPESSMGRGLRSYIKADFDKMIAKEAFAQKMKERGQDFINFDLFRPKTGFYKRYQPFLWNVFDAIYFEMDKLKKGFKDGSKANTKASASAHANSVSAVNAVGT